MLGLLFYAISKANWYYNSNFDDDMNFAQELLKEFCRRCGNGVENATGDHT